MFHQAVLTLSLLVGLATARPDVSLGYHYHPSQASAGSDFLSAPTQQVADVSAISSYGPTASGSSYFSSAGSVGQYDSSSSSGGSSVDVATNNQIGLIGNTFSGSSSSGNSYNAGSASNSFSGFSGAATSSSQSSVVNLQEQEAFLKHNYNYGAPIVSKHFYYFSTPEDVDTQEIVKHVYVGPPRKDYKIIFIKTPSSTATKAKIIADVAPTEDKTAIYLLSKKANALDVSAEVVTHRPLTSKPEVFLLKYKTPEELIHNEHTVQAQYDALSGSTDVSDGGLVQVSSFVDSVQGSKSSDSSVDFINTSSDISATDSLKEAGVEIQHIGDNVSGVSSVSGNNVYQSYLPPKHNKY